MPDQNHTDGVQASLYDQGVEIDNVFEFDPGVCVLPVAEDPPDSEGELATWSPVVILRLHAPYRIRKTRYDASKSNNPPVMPTPEKDSGNFVFLGGALGVKNSMNQSYHSFDWRCVSEYSYVENNVSRNQDGYVLGTGPWNTLTAEINKLNFSPSARTVGAVAHAGEEVLVAAGMGDAIVPDANSAGTYSYNMNSYLPGTFFSDNLVNGGQPVVTSQQA